MVHNRGENTITLNQAQLQKSLKRPTVKRWIRGAISAPAEFSSSERDALIKGEAVDLDIVCSALHLLNYPEEKRRSYWAY
ncbi:hypothetical protein CVT25_002909 [Psilocybe cyanescens]|uniref:Uncharacterized protein n=1 Tax=Psilocybe cyanescens TaxID=93625 RepID=A0A409X5V2_PSICY|nr:hypothetical protein CVT25_002909 [Psilocybe cyanescens]